MLTSEEFLNKYSRHLNENQRKAVQTINGPGLLLAVPGSGKTKLLENQQLIKTPVVRNGKQATVGYQPDVWKGWN